MKKIIFYLALMFSSSMFSQVGVNTTSPAATLDVQAKNATGTTTNVDGLIVPRVDRQRAQSMASIPTSTLIYINNIVTGSQTGTTINVDAVGYYYYNGTVWVKLNTPSSSSVNIYNSNGTLTGNRIVTQGLNTLAFTSNAVNGFSVSGTTFSVDGSNNRVGLGIAAPLALLHVNGGESRFSNSTSAWALFPSTGGTPGASNSFEIIDRINNQRRMVFGDNGDVSVGGTIVSNSGGGVISIRSGNVGIGTASPTQKLHVIGNIIASGTITPSDIRIKKDIVDNIYGLDQILKLRTINYRYKDERLSKVKKVGFIAQEIKKSMPELVTTANDEMKTLGVNYAEMTVVLTKAMQEQQRMIKDQQSQINELKAQIKQVNLKP